MRVWKLLMDVWYGVCCALPLCLVVLAQSLVFLLAEILDFDCTRGFLQCTPFLA